MHVRTRRAGEEIRIGDEIAVTVVDCQGDKVRVGIQASPEVPVGRAEVAARNRNEREGTHGLDGGETSSDDLRRRVIDFLYARQVPGVAGLQIETHAGTVVIRGRLASPLAKRLCLACCRRVAGVISLVDELDVVNR